MISLRFQDARENDEVSNIGYQQEHQGFALRSVQRKWNYNRDSQRRETRVDGNSREKRSDHRGRPGIGKRLAIGFAEAGARVGCYPVAKANWTWPNWKSSKPAATLFASGPTCAIWSSCRRPPTAARRLRRSRRADYRRGHPGAGWTVSPRMSQGVERDDRDQSDRSGQFLPRRSAGHGGETLGEIS